MNSLAVCPWGGRGRLYYGHSVRSRKGFSQTFFKRLLKAFSFLVLSRVTILPNRLCDCAVLD
jgi:hypothetical protein